MNCKPGDRAECIAGAFIGEQCDVIADGGGYTHLPSGRWMHGWTVAFDRPMPWGQPSDCAPDMSEGWYPDAWLRPIRPPSQEDETETVKEMESV